MRVVDPSVICYRYMYMYVSIQVILGHQNSIAYLCIFQKRSFTKTKFKLIFSIRYLLNLLKQPSILSTGSTIIHNHANYPLMFYTHPFFLNTSTTLLLKISVLSFREGAQKNLLTLGPSCVCEILWSFVIFSG